MSEQIEITINLQTPQQIAETLKAQRDGIEKDVDAAIEDFINNANKLGVSTLVKGIEAFGNTEEGFRAWKDFVRNEDDIALRNKLKGRKISLRKSYALMSESIGSVQRQSGDKPNGLGNALQTVFGLAAGSVMAGNNRGGLDIRQEAVFESFLAFSMRYAEPGASIEPLTAVLAPHLRKAVQEKLTTSFGDLKKQIGKPLVEESLVRSLRGDILARAYARFDRLVTQMVTPPASPLPDYGFKPAQMPQGFKFGIEFEGFSGLKDDYPANLMKLSSIFNQCSLKSGVALLPKQDRKYDEWKLTVDHSIISPLAFNGRYNLVERIKKASSFELVSPILSGAAGAQQLKNAETVLEAIDFRSNETCGLHMHADLSKTTLQQKKNLVKALHANEAEIDNLTLPERRGDQSKFALSIQNIDLAAVDTAKTVEELVAIVNPKNDRNSKFDFTGLVLPGAPTTLQYRGAGGANYLGTVTDYAVILGNFTQQGLDNPSVRLETVIKNLVEQRDQLANDNAPVHKKASGPGL